MALHWIHCSTKASKLQWAVSLNITLSRHLCLNYYKQAQFYKVLVFTHRNFTEYAFQYTKNICALHNLKECHQGHGQRIILKSNDHLIDICQLLKYPSFNNSFHVSTYSLTSTYWKVMFARMLVGLRHSSNAKCQKRAIWKLNEIKYNNNNNNFYVWSESFYPAC